MVDLGHAPSEFAAPGLAAGLFLTLSLKPGAWTLLPLTETSGFP
jgi:hypothetical protein